MKKDAPSGTLLRLVEKMQEAGYARRIDQASNRAGAVPGSHQIGFDSEADTIQLIHTARSRVGFAPRCTAHRPLDHRAQGAVRVLNGLGPHGGRALGKLNRLGR